MMSHFRHEGVLISESKHHGGYAGTSRRRRWHRACPTTAVYISHCQRYVTTILRSQSSEHARCLLASPLARFARRDRALYDLRCVHLIILHLYHRVCKAAENKGIYSYTSRYLSFPLSQRSRI